MLVSASTADGLACDPWAQDEDSRLSRKIRSASAGRSTTATVVARVPTCGARGFLHNHHQGGWRQVGHDPDLLMLLCAVHRALHHDGRMSITGRDSAGFRFFRRDGLELVPPMRLLWEPNPFATSEAA